MRLSEFILLGEEEKKGTVLHEGILLAKRETEDYKVFLFGACAFLKLPFNTCTG